MSGKENGREWETSGVSETRRYVREAVFEDYTVEVYDGTVIDVKRVGGEWVYPVLGDNGKKLRTEHHPYRPEEPINIYKEIPSFYQVAKECRYGLNKGGKQLPAGHIWDTDRLPQYKE